MDSVSSYSKYIPSTQFSQFYIKVAMHKQVTEMALKYCTLKHADEDRIPLGAGPTLTSTAKYAIVLYVHTDHMFCVQPALATYANSRCR